MKSLFYIILFFSVSVSAQIKITLIDSITQKPIPYVGVWNNENGNSYFSSNKRGKLKIPKINPETELFFFTSSYQSKTIKAKNCNEKVFLQPKPKDSNTDSKPIQSVENYYVFDNLDFKEKKTFRSLGIIATYIPYSKEVDDSPYISKIKFNFLPSEKDVKYKIRFFEANQDLQPSNEIGQQEIIVKAKRTIYQKKDNINRYIDDDKDVDLLKYRVKFPKNGIFIVLETLLLKENLTVVQLPSNNKKLETYLPFVTMNNTKKDIKYTIKNNKWSKLEDHADIAMKVVLSN